MPVAPDVLAAGHRAELEAGYHDRQTTEASPAEPAVRRDIGRSAGGARRRLIRIGVAGAVVAAAVLAVEATHGFGVPHLATAGRSAVTSAAALGAVGPRPGGGLGGSAGQPGCDRGLRSRCARSWSDTASRQGTCWRSVRAPRIRWVPGWCWRLPLLTLDTLAASEPVQIEAFLDDGPGASPGLPMRAAELTAAPGAARHTLAFFRAQRQPYLADSAAVTAQGSGGSVLTRQFAVPVPLGLLPASAVTRLTLLAHFATIWSERTVASRSRHPRARRP